MAGSSERPRAQASHSDVPSPDGPVHCDGSDTPTSGVGGPGEIAGQRGQESAWQGQQPTAMAAAERNRLGRTTGAPTAPRADEDGDAVPTIQQLVRKGRQDKVAKNKTPALK